MNYICLQAFCVLVLVLVLVLASPARPHFPLLGVSHILPNKSLANHANINVYLVLGTCLIRLTMWDSVSYEAYEQAYKLFIYLFIYLCDHLKNGFFSLLGLRCIQCQQKYHYHLSSM